MLVNNILLLEMAAWLSFLGGLAAKAYDDLNDNHMLEEFRNSTFEEFLKGTHYISFTGVSIGDPMFFYVSYIANVLNHVANEDAYKEPYEYSLLLSFLIIFLILHDTRTPRVSLLESAILILFCMGMYLEPVVFRLFFGNEEVSHGKMYSRTFFLLYSMFITVLGISKTTSNVFSYAAGYFALSVIVQYYSLYVKNKPSACGVSSWGSLVRQMEELQAECPVGPTPCIVPKCVV